MPPNKILVDSSFLIAFYDRNAIQHANVKEIATLYRGQFLVPQVTLTEVVHLWKRAVGIHEAIQFLEEFNNSRPDLQDVTVPDLRRAKGIMPQYVDARLDFVDCCIMALSERLNITQVGTFDRRDFSIFRPKHIDYLELLP
jgi:uncharacterized protein